MSYGMRVSKSGYSVKTGDTKDMIMDSDANSLKVYAAGSVNVSVAGGGATSTATVAHNLGYPPFYRVFFKLKDANKIWQEDCTDATRLLANFNNGFGSTDNTNLNISIYSDEASGYTATVYYILFIDQAYE